MNEHEIDEVERHQEIEDAFRELVATFGDCQLCDTLTENDRDAIELFIGRNRRPNSGYQVFMKYLFSCDRKRQAAIVEEVFHRFDDVVASLVPSDGNIEDGHIKDKNRTIFIMLSSLYPLLQAYRDDPDADPTDFDNNRDAWRQLFESRQSFEFFDQAFRRGVAGNMGHGLEIIKIDTENKEPN